MPHDKNGQELKVGDKVTIECEVKTISPGTDYCNLQVESVEGRKPDGNKEFFTLNAAVVVKVAVLAFAFLFMGGSAVAQDKDVLWKFEKRLDNLEARVTKLEAAAGWKFENQPQSGAPGTALQSYQLAPVAASQAVCGEAGCSTVTATRDGWFPGKIFGRRR